MRATSCSPTPIAPGMRRASIARAASARTSTTIGRGSALISSISSATSMRAMAWGIKCCICNDQCRWLR
jgi:hypothetical protein